MLMSFGGSGKEMGKLGRDNYGKKTIIGAITWISHSNKWRFNDQNFNIQNSARREIKGTQFCQIMPAPYFNHVEIIASQR